MKFCGIDLAVKRPSAVGVLENDVVCVKELMKDEEIYEECKDSVVVSIDSPLSHSKGYREVDKEMIRRGYRVLPPSWMISLVDRAIRLSSLFKTVIETHPTSSLKNLGIDWRKYSNKKDIIDAVVCALVSYYFYLGKAVEISANDGKIYILPPMKLKIIKINENCFRIFFRDPLVSFLS